MKLTNYVAAALLGLALMLSGHAAQAQWLFAGVAGKLWIVNSNVVSGGVAFPAPTTVPDATFSTNNGMMVFSTSSVIPGGSNNIATLLFNRVYNLKLSRKLNPVLNAAVTGKTPLYGWVPGFVQYCALIEFDYPGVLIQSGQALHVLHSGGVAVTVYASIGTKQIAGFRNTLGDSISDTGAPWPYGNGNDVPASILWSSCGSSAQFAVSVN